MRKDVRITIAGDFFVDDNFIDNELFSEEVVSLFKESDLRIANLEAPIVESKTPIKKILKTGPSLKMNDRVISKVINKLRINLLTLANNHILDYNSTGLINTMNILKYNKLDYVGAGMSLLDATLPFSFFLNGLTVCILNFAENEWSIAKKNKPGANPLDIISNIKQIKAAKNTHDFVIVIIHGGIEYFHYPSPRMVELYRFYAESGADAIVNHHTHCIGGYEIYKSVPIFYSIGNFIFTRPSKKPEWYNGLILSLKLEKGKSIHYEINPIRQDMNNYKVELLKAKNKEIVFDLLKKINEIITNEKQLNIVWQNFIIDYHEHYLKMCVPFYSINNRLLRASFFKTNMWKIFLTKKYIRLMLNLVRCESHRDILTYALQYKNMLNK